MIEHKTIRSRRKTLGLEVNSDGVLVRAPYYAKEADINSFLEKNRDWIEKHLAEAEERKKILDGLPPLTKEETEELAARAAEVIPERVKYYASRIGVDYGKITIRNQRTRWGSCSAGGNLSFNCLLMLAPPEVTDSVVVHELCHRKEMNHSGKFYAEVFRVFPEYKKWNMWLKKNGGMIMASMKNGREL